MSIARRRLSPAASRQMALDAARDILIESGPQAVTLKAVAGRIGRTHANLLHHFGSAAELQRELAAFLCHGVCNAIGERMRSHAPGEHKVREIVDLAFDSFNQGGGGRADQLDADDRQRRGDRPGGQCHSYADRQPEPRSAQAKIAP